MTLSKKQRKMVKTDLAQAADTVDEDQTTAVALIVTDIGGGYGVCSRRLY